MKYLQLSDSQFELLANIIANEAEWAHENVYNAQETKDLLSLNEQILLQSPSYATLSEAKVFVEGLGFNVVDYKEGKELRAQRDEDYILITDDKTHLTTHITTPTTFITI